jgi:hypothetical protein
MLGALLGGYLNKVRAVLRQGIVSATAKHSSSDNAASSAKGCCMRRTNPVNDLINGCAWKTANSAPISGWCVASTVSSLLLVRC